MLKFQKPKNIGSLTWILLVLIKQKCNGSHINSDLNGSYDIWLYIMVSTLVGSVLLDIMVKIGVVMAIMATIAV